MNYENELNILKENLDKAKNLKYRAEARLEQLAQQEEEIIKDLEELGVRPEELKDEIVKLSNVIESLFKEANELLPTHILEEKDKND